MESRSGRSVCRRWVDGVAAPRGAFAGVGESETAGCWELGPGHERAGRVKTVSFRWCCCCSAQPGVCRWTSTWATKLGGQEGIGEAALKNKPECVRRRGAYACACVRVWHVCLCVRSKVKLNAFLLQVMPSCPSRVLPEGQSISKVPRSTTRTCICYGSTSRRVEGCGCLDTIED